MIRMIAILGLRFLTNKVSKLPKIMTLINEIRLLIKIDEEPTDKDKQIIESLLKSILLDIDPVAEVKMKTGFGSWIILVWTSLENVAGWLIPEFGSWLAGKGFDWLQNRIGQSKRLLIAKEGGNLMVHEQEKDPMSESNVPGALESLQANNESETLRKLANQMANVVENPVFSTSKKVTFKVAEWSSSRNLGISASFTKVKDERNETELEFLVDLTDSKEDFNSRFNF